MIEAFALLIIGAFLLFVLAVLIAVMPAVLAVGALVFVVWLFTTGNGAVFLLVVAAACTAFAIYKELDKRPPD